MNFSKRLLTLSGLCCLAAFSANAAIWQWSVLVKGEKPQNGPARAFLWIPPHCEHVCGVVVAQNNMEEEMILDNPHFREAMSRLNFAEVWVSPFFDHLFRFNQGAGEVFNNMMNRLADVSGYSELKCDPIVTLGHSAAASWPYYFAAWDPGRTLCAISTSGQWPYWRNPIFAPDIWGKRTINYVPCLETMGEYGSANTWSTAGLRERKEYPLTPLSMLACPAEGHFAATDRKVKYLALYIQKAMEYRMPKHWNVKRPPKLKPIDPKKSGWLVQKWRRNHKPTVPPAPVGQYKGNPKEAFWLFDKQLAEATEKYEAAYRGLKPQLLGFVQDGKMAPQRNTHLQVRLKFEPEADGVTFHLKGAFYQRVPGGSPYPPQWAELPVGAPLGHATGAPVSIERICGPFAKLGPGTFAVHFRRDTLLDTNAHWYDLVFAATQVGDKEYKPAVQQAHMFIPARNTQGEAQHITFPASVLKDEGHKVA